MIPVLVQSKGIKFADIVLVNCQTFVRLCSLFIVEIEDMQIVTPLQ